MKPALSWLFTRYHPRYIRSLVYMLQSSEYHPGEYLAWYHRVRDFAHVERRGHLVLTAKSRALLVLAAFIYAVLITAAVVFVWFPGGPLGLAAAATGLFLAPSLTAYLLPIPLMLGRMLIQAPIERRQEAATRAHLLQHPAQRIAIAGSFGKTSMREIISTVLSAGRRVAAPPHSFNTPAGIASFVSHLTGEEEILVFELGEYYPGDVQHLAELTLPQLGIITGVNEAHLAKFRTLDRTTGAIFELADYLGDQPVYVNGESPHATAAARPGHLVYTRAGLLGWQVAHAHTGLDGTSFTLIGHGLALQLHTTLLGLHQIGPIAVAVDIAHRFGLTAEQITAGVAALTAFEHRLQPSTDAHGVTLLDDSYNGNPDGVAAVIAFLAGLTDRRRFYITPGLVEMGRRTREVHEAIGRQLAAAGVEHVVLIRTSAASHIAAGLAAAGYRGTLTWQPDMPTALAALPHLTVRGDVVLIQNDWPDQYQ